MSERYEGRTNMDDRRSWGRGDDWSTRTGRDDDRGRWNEMDEDRGYDPRRFGGTDDRGRMGMGDRWRGISDERRGMFEDRNRYDASFNRGYDDSYDIGYGGGSMASGYGRDTWGTEGTFRRDFGPGYYEGREDDRFRSGGMMGRGMMGQGMMGQGRWNQMQGGYPGYQGYQGYQGYPSGYQGQGGFQGRGFQTRGFQGGYQGQGGYPGEYQGQMMNQGPYAGKGPKGYIRNYDRVREDVNEALARHPLIDASEIEVQVDKGEVMLVGTVNDRNQKRLAEIVVEQVDGVSDVHNQLRVLLNPDRSQTGGNGGDQRMPGMNPAARNPQQTTQVGAKKRTDQD